MKVCTGCDTEKEDSDFYARSNRRNGLQHLCKSCQNSTRWKDGRFRDEEHKQQILKSNRESYQRNKEKYQEKANRRNARLKIDALEAHGSLSCQRCGYDLHPSALEFHHRDPQEKLFNVSSAVTTPKKYPWSMILKELEKCDVICANCHKIEHCRRGYDGLWEVKKSLINKEDFLGQKG